MKKLPSLQRKYFRKSPRSMPDSFFFPHEFSSSYLAFVYAKPFFFSFRHLFHFSPDAWLLSLNSSLRSLFFLFSCLFLQNTLDSFLSQSLCLSPSLSFCLPFFLPLSPPPSLSLSLSLSLS